MPGKVAKYLGLGSRPISPVVWGGLLHLWWLLYERDCSNRARRHDVHPIRGIVVILGHRWTHHRILAADAGTSDKCMTIVMASPRLTFQGEGLDQSSGWVTHEDPIVVLTRFGVILKSEQSTRISFKPERRSNRICIRQCDDITHIGTLTMHLKVMYYSSIVVEKRGLHENLNRMHHLMCTYPFVIVLIYDISNG